MTARIARVRLSPLVVTSSNSYIDAGWEALPLDNGGLRDLVQAHLEAGASVRFRALGFSMSPFVKPGDVLTIAPERPHLGDLAAFLGPEANRLIVHRVIRAHPGGHLIKGDNVAVVDGVIASDAILGRVTRVERENKSIRLGIGPERVAIALLSRMGVLRALTRTIAAILRIPRRLQRVGQERHRA